MKQLQNALRAVIQKEMDQDPAHDLAHVDRVWENAHRIAKHEVAVNLRVLLASSYLHDLVNLPKNHPDRKQASSMSADAAEAILKEMNFSKAEIDAVKHAIRAHSYSAGIPPETIEAKILRDADRLDALGATGIARVFSVGGALGRKLYDSEDPFAENRDLDDQSNTLDHWRIKLLKLPHDMLTEKGREIGRKRVHLMVSFLEQLAKETGRDLPENWISMDEGHTPDLAPAP